MRVFVTHNPEDRSAYFGRAMPELEAIAEVVVNPMNRDLTTDELLGVAEQCQVIIAHRSTPGEATIFEESPDLIAFLRCAVDVSTIDIEAASANGVLVGRADNSFVPATAELALGLLIASFRNVAESTVDYRRGLNPAQRPGQQLRGRVAGIIGYGAIGSYLADLLASVGMEVLVSDPIDRTTGTGVEQVDLDELLRRADAVFPLAPATPETENLINVETLAMMKPGATLVNVSRGELVDETAVAEALDSGQLGGLAIDVGRAPDQRPSPELVSRPGVVATPHLGGLTAENADAQAMSSVEQVTAMLAREMPPRTVNPDAATRLAEFWA